MEDGACRPLPGQTYLAIGQDLFSIEEYLREQYNASLHEFIRRQQKHPNETKHSITAKLDMVPTRASVLPAAVMFYTDIQTLAGLLDGPADYGSGIEYADGLLELVTTTSRRSSYNNNDHRRHSQNPTVALQIGLWLNGTSGCADLVAGRWDAQLQKLFQYLLVPPQQSQSQPQAQHYWQKTFLRVGYEFDNPAFGYYDSDNDDAGRLYRTAFRYVVHACHAWYTRPVCARYVAFVWHSWAAGLPNNNTTLNDFYPGDDYVDWIGVSLFSQLAPPNPTGLGSRDTVTQVLEFASASHSPYRRNGRPNHSLPVMIAESTPFGGLDHYRDPWKDWFEPLLQLLDDYPSIGLWSYINCNWDEQPLWHGVGFGDTRLSTNATLMELWQQHVLHNPRFVPMPSTSCGSTTETSRTMTATATITNPMERSYGGILMPLYKAIKKYKRQQRHIRASRPKDNWTTNTQIGPETAASVTALMMLVVVILVVPLSLLVSVYRVRRHRRRGRIQCSGWRNHDAPSVNPHPPARHDDPDTNHNPQPPQLSCVQVQHESRIPYYGSLSET